MSVELLYLNSCPNCGSQITSSRLAQGLVCEKCLPQPVPYGQVCQHLKTGQHAQFCQVLDQKKQFEKFFSSQTGNQLRQIQRMWAYRFFAGYSFALIAPTGIGKTTFGLMLSLFLANKNKKSYLIFPTQLIVNQVYSRIVQYLPDQEQVLAYSNKLQTSQKQKQQAKDRIRAGDFDILITTTMFLYKNHDILPKGVWDLVFIDDVDSILKSARNIDKVLQLLNFSPEDISKALELIEFKRKLAAKEVSQQQMAEFNDLKQQVEQISSKRHGNLLVSSATANPRASRIKLFTELLGFEVGRPSISIRNVVDVYRYAGEDLWEQSVELIKRFGGGGLVYLPTEKTKQDLQQYLEFLRSKGIEAASYEDFEKQKEQFRSGQLQVFVGFASYRNPLARGLDMPDVVRYAIFVGVPKLRFTLDLDKHTGVYYFVLLLNSFLAKNQLVDDKTLYRLSQYVEYLGKFLFIPGERLLPQVKSKIKQIVEQVVALLDKGLIERINQSRDISLVYMDGQFSIVTADVTGYIQASGRTSRLYAGGLTLGLSFLLVDSEKAFVSLQKKVRQFYEDIEFKHESGVDLERVLEQIDRDREQVRRALRGDVTGVGDSTITAAVIVESPNKARTIAGFFGKPVRRRIAGLDVYEVTAQNMLLQIAASAGHIFDLNKEQGYYGVLHQSGAGFVPVFEPIEAKKQQIIQALRRLAAEVSRVYVATDPDVEGEKIGYDIMLNLRPFQQQIVRAYFHEVSRRAFMEAVTSPRQFSLPLVKAQLVRRISDRWIGFKISQYLQKKFHNPSLSAGRVQTPVLGWIVEREKLARQYIYIFGTKLSGLEIEFEHENYKTIAGLYFKAKQIQIRFISQEQKQLSVKPFSTDKMLFAAAGKLGFSPQTTMKLAQDLFEAGFITYHRTDSIRVSQNGLNVAKQYISENFGEQFFKPRTFESSGGAHECIRPVKPVDAQELKTFLKMNNRTDLTNNHIKLYDIIFKRFIASQMKPATVLQITAEARVNSFTKQFEFIKEVLDHGYDLIEPIKTHNLTSGTFPITYKYTRKRPKIQRFTFATIISEMKNKGIGRPSTYAITIQKLLERRYIIDKNGVLYPTKLGQMVYEHLKSQENYYRFVNEEYTRALEGQMDWVEQGSRDWQEVLTMLFDQIFHEKS